MGDLIYFRGTTKGELDHVAVYLGNNQIVDVGHSQGMVGFRTLEEVLAQGESIDKVTRPLDAPRKK